MEALDKALARQAASLDQRRAVKPVIARTFDDIRRIVSEFDPKRNPLKTEHLLSALMNVSGADQKNVTYRVTSTTKSKSKRDTIIEGLNVIKTRLDSSTKIVELSEGIEINGVVMNPAKVGYEIEGSNWVDPLIHKWMGATRDGIMICWKLDDGFTYRYSIYDHRLTRVKNGEN